MPLKFILHCTFDVHNNTATTICLVWIPTSFLPQIILLMMLVIIISITISTYLFCRHCLHLFFCVLSFVSQLGSVLSLKNLLPILIKFQLDDFHFAWVDANTDSGTICLFTLDPLNVNHLLRNHHKVWGKGKPKLIWKPQRFPLLL